MTESDQMKILILQSENLSSSDVGRVGFRNRATGSIKKKKGCAEIWKTAVDE